MQGFLLTLCKAPPLRWPPSDPTLATVTVHGETNQVLAEANKRCAHGKFRGSFWIFHFPKDRNPSRRMLNRTEQCRRRHEQLNPSKIYKNTLVSVPSGTCWYQTGRDVCLGSDWPTFSENVVENKQNPLVFIEVCDSCDKAWAQENEWLCVKWHARIDRIDAWALLAGN